MNGLAPARAGMRAAVLDKWPAKLAGALGEVQAARVSDAKHASHLLTEYNLERDTVVIESKIHDASDLPY